MTRGHYLPINGTKLDVVGIWSETMSNKIDMANRVVIPKLTFSVRSPLVEAGEKKPTKEISVMINVGTTRLTRKCNGFRCINKYA